MSHKLFQDPPVNDAVLNEEGRISFDWAEWFFDLTSSFTEWYLVKPIINPSSVNPNTTANQSITITQVEDEDGNTITLGSEVVAVAQGDHVVKLIKPTLSAGLIINQVRVSADNTLEVEFGNLTGSAIDPGSETYTLIALKG